jgi:predicted MFS family arabinose efflux permease
MVKDYIRNLKAISTNARWFLAGNLLHWMGLSAFRLLFNLYLQENGWTKTEIGYTISLVAWGTFLVAIPAALLLDRFHIKYLLIIFAFVGSLGFVGRVACIGSLSWVLIFSLLGSMAFTVYHIANAPFLMRNSAGKERIYLFSICSALMLLSTCLGSIAGGYLPKLFQWMGKADTLSRAYELSLYAALAFSLLSCFPYLRLKPGAMPANGAHSLKERFRKFNWKLVARLHLPKVFVGLGAGLMVPYMNLYFDNVFKLESGPIGFLMAGVQVSTFFGMAMAPVLVGRLCKLNTILLTQSVSIPLILILAFTGNLYLAAAAFMLRGMFMNMSNPVKSNFDMEMVEEHEQSLTSALTIMVWNGSWGTTSLIGGWLLEKDPSFRTSFLITAGLYVISSLCYVFVVKPLSKRSREMKAACHSCTEKQF